MTPAEFLIKYPEFGAVDPNFIAAKIAEAALEVDPDVWGRKTDTGIGYLAAHKMALSPAGQAAKLATATGETTYNVHYMQLVRQVSSGYRST